MDVVEKIGHELDTSKESSVDPELVEKALEQAEGEPREVNMACRRDAHPDSRPGATTKDPQGKPCNNKRAVVLSDIMQGLPKGLMLYRCTECGYSWSVPTGGSFPY